MSATLGRIVHYKLTQADAVRINRRRWDFERHRTRDTYHDTGYVAHWGAEVIAGDVLPMIVTRTYDWTDAINGQIFLDGSDTLWVQDVKEGDGEGQWSWPPRV